MQTTVFVKFTHATTVEGLGENRPHGLRKNCHQREIRLNCEAISPEGSNENDLFTNQAVEQWTRVEQWDD
jgi:hypothetical protein